MWEKLIKAAFAASLLGFTSYTYAGEDSQGFYVWADVTDVTPLVTSHVEEIPTTSCRIVRPAKQRHYHDHRQNNALPALFGGVLGGVIGNQFGSGNGKRALTVIGAMAGASIAASRHNHRPVNEPREICETTYETRNYQVLDGYQVTYRYMGREFDRVTDEHPGDRLKIYVTVNPIATNLI